MTPSQTEGEALTERERFWRAWKEWQARAALSAVALPAPIPWIGSIPGEESDEEFARQVESMDGVVPPPAALLVQTPAEPVAWQVTRLHRRNEVRRVTYLFGDLKSAEYEYEGWLEYPNADPKLIPLYAAPGAVQTPSPTEPRGNWGQSPGINGSQGGDA